MWNKFSGFCYLTIKDHEIEENENDDFDIIGEFENLQDGLDFDYDIIPNITEDDEFEKLEDGNYYVYFTGTAEFGSDYIYEYGCYEGYAEFEFDYIHYQKLEDRL